MGNSALQRDVSHIATLQLILVQRSVSQLYRSLVTHPRLIRKLPDTTEHILSFSSQASYLVLASQYCSASCALFPLPLQFGHSNGFSEPTNEQQKYVTHIEGPLLHVL